MVLDAPNETNFVLLELYISVLVPVNCSLAADASPTLKLLLVAVDRKNPSPFAKFVALQLSEKVK